MFNQLRKTVEKKNPGAWEKTIAEATRFKKRHHALQFLALHPDATCEILNEEILVEECRSIAESVHGIERDALILETRKREEEIQRQRPELRQPAEAFAESPRALNHERVFV